MAASEEKKRKGGEGVVLELELVIGSYESLLCGLSYDLLEDEAKLRSKFKEKAHMSSIRSVAASNNGILASGGTDEIIKLYNMRTHTELGTLIQHDGTINYLLFQDDGKYLYSASDDGSVCVWSTHDWQCLHVLKGHKGPVSCVAVHPSGRLALSVGKDRTIRTWDLSTGRCAFIKKFPQALDLVVWSPVGDSYVISSNNHFSLFHVETGPILLQVNVGHHINSIVFITDDIIAVGSESSDILFYSVTKEEQLLISLKGHTNRIKCLSFVPGAGLLFSGSSDGSVKVWKLSMDNISESQCIADADIGARLTCMTLVYPQELEEGGAKKKRKRKTKIQSTSNEEEPMTEQLMKDRAVVTFEEDTISSINKEQKKTRAKKRKKGPGGGAKRPLVTVEYEEEEEEEEEQTEPFVKKNKKSNNGKKVKLDSSKKKKRRHV
ncbi:PREDICTED: p21-activated protein kinase-interacting protein 1-like [Amphimedon queenslandica]|uniref:Uncharacterized protein n=1 Tax=Amphimedon queenslandica TaxID=400682 RepID=A0A1X7U8V5_AMPQE|nr:PREDICTED: p21-activated protein kinase-interacting protein 1-like [Amphimedon queenslandica]|eukprot:XP_003388740.1 PREDICTED: p21-activated protein kinase-interacting protein 1-like [Amphimedon queenslandica]